MRRQVITALDSRTVIRLEVPVVYLASRRYLLIYLARDHTPSGSFLLSGRKRKGGCVGRALSVIEENRSVVGQRIRHDNILGGGYLLDLPVCWVTYRSVDNPHPRRGYRFAR